MEIKTVKEDIRKKICEIISEMLDNPDKYEIYPTTRCYDKLERYIKDLIQDKTKANWRGRWMKK